MQVSQAKKMGLELMREHLNGRSIEGWSLKFDEAKRRFGVCRYRKKEISLSRPIVRLNSEAEARDVILHEIAHAIAGKKAGHGAKWKAVCVEIGAKPERCYDGEKVATPKAKYTAVCNGCLTEHKRHRRPNPRSSCGTCCAGVYNDKYILIWMN